MYFIVFYCSLIQLSDDKCIEKCNGLIKQVIIELTIWESTVLFDYIIDINKF